ncbi:hypothetical protein [Sphingosinicella ginsenosidimutans]|uniref:hypothetical protein n=1 Tax=Allosphingosinicella ginsenosidimutans TaxID=1176539 RepID=UPI00131520EF|nr:hypothetical protein [Sphingosinicella ginsenosidimutans]
MEALLSGPCDQPLPSRFRVVVIVVIMAKSVQAAVSMPMPARSKERNWATVDIARNFSTAAARHHAGSLV